MKLAGPLFQFLPTIFQVSPALRARLPLARQLIQSSLMLVLAVAEFLRAALELGVLLLELQFSLGKLIGPPRVGTITFVVPAGLLGREFVLQPLEINDLLAKL